MMRFRVCLAAFVGVVIAAGCSSQPPTQPPATPATPSTGPTASNNPTGSNPAQVTTAPPPHVPATDPTMKPGTAKLTPSTAVATTTKIPPPPTPNDGNWHLVNVSPQQIASTTDQMIKSLTNVKGTIQYALRTQAGDAQGTLIEKIKDSKTYSLQYPVIANDKKRGQLPLISYAQADGSEPKESIRGVPPKDADERVESWPLYANREIFAGLLEGRQPFSDYIAALMDPKNGYTTTVKERSVPYKGKTVRDYQIQAVRTGSQAGMLGPSVVTIMIDSDIALPVTIAASVKRPGAAHEDSLVWNAQWVNNVKFDPKEFKPLPPPMKVK